MPDERLARTRRSLPEGYQFGDARWRRPSENAAEQLARRAGWNVIEGEHGFDLASPSDAERVPVIEGAR